MIRKESSRILYTRRTKEIPVKSFRNGFAEARIKDSGDIVSPRLELMPPQLLLLQPSQSSQQWFASPMVGDILVRAKKNVQCFKFGHKGHYASECKPENPGVICY